MDATAPGLLLAQGIGRIGNWWNQELYGKPTTLPWGLEINLAHRAGIAAAVPQRQGLPADLPLRAALGPRRRRAADLAFARRTSFRPPALFALYVAYYCFGRFFEELLRIDPSHHFLGLRLNAWVSAVVFVAASAFFVWWQLLGHGGEPDRSPPRRAPSRGRCPQGPKMAIPRGPRPLRRLASARWKPRQLRSAELELELDAFEGPFDLLLALVLREELALAELDLAEVVIAFVAQLDAREQLDLDACGEFLVLISALLELKARGLFEVDEGSSSTSSSRSWRPRSSRDGSRSTGASRRRADWLAGATRGDAGALLPPRAARRCRRASPSRSSRCRTTPRCSRRALRGARDRAAAPSTAHMALRFPPLGQFVERWRRTAAPPSAARFRSGGGRLHAHRDRRRLPRRCSSCASSGS